MASQQRESIFLLHDSFFSNDDTSANSFATLQKCESYLHRVCKSDDKCRNILQMYLILDSKITTFTLGVKFTLNGFSSSNENEMSHFLCS